MDAVLDAVKRTLPEKVILNKRKKGLKFILGLPLIGLRITGARYVQS